MTTRPCGLRCAGKNVHGEYVRRCTTQLDTTAQQTVCIMVETTARRRKTKILLKSTYNKQSDQCGVAGVKRYHG